MSMFVHSRNDKIKMNKDFHWKIKPSIETTLLWICTGHNLVKFYNVNYPHCNWKCTMLNWLFAMSIRWQTSFFRHRTEKVRCRHDVDPIRKSTKLCTVVYGKLLEFLKTMFKQLFIIYSNSLAIDSFNFLKIFEYI